MNEWEDAPEVDRRKPEWEDAPVVERRAATPWRERFATGLADPIIGLGQVADRFLVNPIRQAISPGATSMEDVVKRRNAEYVPPEGIDWARMGGNVANPISWAGGGAGLGRVAATGAVQAGMAPTEAGLGLGDFATEKVKQAGLGGVSAGVLSKVLPRALRMQAVKPNEAGAALQAQGVRVTPGQAAGGWANALEQKATSIPIAGDVIQTARRRALEDVQSKAIERATGIPGVKSIDDANEAVSDLYRQAVPHLKPNAEGFYGASEALYKAVDNPELTPQHVKTLEGLFKNTFANYERLDGPGLKKLDSELGALGRKYSGHGASPADQSLGEAIYAIRQGMREGWEQGLDPKHARTLREANAAYRGMIAVNKAASTRGDELVTPRALQKALARQAGTDVTRMRADPLLDPAVKALGSTVPDSGTAGRMLQGGAVGAAFADPVSTLLGAAGTWAGTKAAYSKPGVDILTGNTRLQRGLAKQAPAVRKATVAALRAQLARDDENQH
jgi:hypothetical protein